MDPVKPIDKPADQQRIDDSSRMPPHAPELDPRSPRRGDETVDPRAINPRNVDSMPRAEDDDITRQRSPEFHDEWNRQVSGDRRGPGGDASGSQTGSSPMPRQEDQRISKSRPDRDAAADQGRPDDPSTHGTATDTGLPADHSERAWGGDQDIDTAGVVPETKETDDKDTRR